MVQSIDGWVVREAVKLLAASPEHKTTLNVNVSGRSIGSPEFAAGNPCSTSMGWTRRASCSSSLKQQRSATSSRRNRFACACGRWAAENRPRRLRVRLRWFRYLNKLPFDVLKNISPEISQGPDRRHDRGGGRAKAIVTISREMGKKTVAEFVESAEMASFLRDNGVDCGQGCRLGPPGPVSHSPGNGHHRLARRPCLRPTRPGERLDPSDAAVRADAGVDARPRSRAGGGGRYRSLARAAGQPAGASTAHIGSRACRRRSSWSATRSASRRFAALRARTSRGPPGSCTRRTASSRWTWPAAAPPVSSRRSSARGRWRSIANPHPSLPRRGPSARWRC